MYFYKRATIRPKRHQGIMHAQIPTYNWRACSVYHIHPNLYAYLCERWL